MTTLKIYLSRAAEARGSGIGAGTHTAAEQSGILKSILLIRRLEVTPTFLKKI